MFDVGVRTEGGGGGGRRRGFRGEDVTVDDWREGGKGGGRLVGLLGGIFFFSLLLILC
jgi:hypothetical protein